MMGDTTDWWYWDVLVRPNLCLCKIVGRLGLGDSLLCFLFIPSHFHTRVFMGSSSMSSTISTGLLLTGAPLADLFLVVTFTSRLSVDLVVEDLACPDLDLAWDLLGPIFNFSFLKISK